MKNRRSRHGSTLVEILVSFAILATTGVFMVKFLYKNPMTQRAWTDCYGFELSKVVLLTNQVQADTSFTHTDANGIHWETHIRATKDEHEICYRAVSVRNGKDSTRVLNYCTYGDFE